MENQIQDAPAHVARSCPLTTYILLGCSAYNVTRLQDILCEKLRSISPRVYHKSLHPDEWGRFPWYPLLALKRVETNSIRPSKTLQKPNKAFNDSRPAREWAIYRSILLANLEAADEGHP